MLPIIDEKKPWYGEGLSFKCTGCGKCCTGAPGFVFVSVQEIEAMADYLKISVEEFSKRYLRKVGPHYSLKEMGKENDCVFLKGNQCQVYPTRPIQCQTYPFWPRVLKSKKSWDAEAKWCEGISKEAPTVPYEHIEEECKRSPSML